jgi:hypothetical protein
MKPKVSSAFFIMLLLILLCMAGEIYAQGCSQCKMIPMSDQQGGGTAAKGINKAILYIMAMPYIVLCILFRKQIVRFYRQLTDKHKA